MIVLLLWMALALQVCDCLCPTRLSSYPSTSSSLMASSSLPGGNDKNAGSSSISRARQRDRKARTLYDYLGASPKDTQEQLRIRYTTLAKTLHPDSNPDRDVKNFYYDLGEINAAWEILKDPVERKRYDRSLQTKEITEGIESLVTMGLESFATTAIPWLQKTAVTTAAATAAAADASTKAAKEASKAAKEVNAQAKTAYGAFEIEQQIKALEQKSNADRIRASKIQKELVALPTKKIVSLEKKQQRQQQPLTSMEAQKILKSFQMTKSVMKPSPFGLSNDIKVLTETESKHKDALRVSQSAERSTQLASRKVEQAVKAEEMAQKRLLEAQLAVKEAKKISAAAQEADRKAKAEERLAIQSSTKVETMLQKTRDKVRIGLLQQQDIFLEAKAKELKKEKEECEKSSKKYLDEAKALRIKSKKK